MSVSSAYGSYFDLVKSRLESSGFKTEAKANVGDMVVDLIGHKESTFPSSRAWFVSLNYLDKVDTAKLEPYFNAVRHKADELSARYRLAISLPVAASSEFDEALKERVQTTKLYAQPRLVVGISIQAHPVLADLKTRQIYHYTKMEFVGYAELRKARNFAEEHFKFQ